MDMDQWAKVLTVLVLMMCALPSMHGPHMFYRAIEGQTPVVAPLDWFGRCDDNSFGIRRLPRDFTASNLPFVDVYCVGSHEQRDSVTDPVYGYWNDEFSAGNDRGGVFKFGGT
jgi:hypothetical protein